MTFTVSHRQAGVTRQQIGRLVRHNFRDVDKSNGVETSHSNELIDPERTPFNHSVLWIGGTPTGLTGTNRILDELDRRLEKAGTIIKRKDGTLRKKAIRKDSKVVREIVLQLDPEFTGSSKDILNRTPAENKEFYRYMDVLMEHYVDLYGADNLLASSLHLDETSPHVHLLVTPIAPDGRLSQEAFLKGPQAMRKNDRDLRKRLKEAGYDVDPQPRGGGRSHLTKEQYSAWREREATAERERQEAEKKAKAQVKEAEQQRLDVIRQYTALTQQAEAEINARQRALDERQEALDARERHLATLEAEKAAYEAARASYEAANRDMGAALAAIQRGSIQIRPEQAPTVKNAYEQVRASSQHVKRVEQQFGAVLPRRSQPHSPEGPSL